MVSKTKIDYTFPASRFIITDFAAPFRFDQTDKRGGYLHTYSKMLKMHYIRDNTECLTIEILFF